MPKIDVYALAFSVSNSLPVRAYQEDFEEFARLILEEAAKACRNEMLSNTNDMWKEGHNDGCEYCAAAIRALKP